MKGGQPQQRQPEPDPVNLSAQEIVSSQEVAVVPWFRGTQKIALHWISGIYNQFTKDVPTSSKKDK